MTFAAIAERQRHYFLDGPTQPLAFRKQALRRLQRALETHESGLLDALHRDLGKSPAEAYTSELGFVKAEIRQALRHLENWAAPRPQPTPLLLFASRSWIVPRPKGTVLILGPWNYPVQLLLAPLVPALAAGNCAVLKPSELAPLVSARLAEMFRDMFPPDYCQVVEGGADTARALLQQTWDHVFFTGSVPVGRRVMAAAAIHGTPVTLELGGKNPCVICGNVPLEACAERIAWGKWLNAGQTCVAPDHVWVPRARLPELTAALLRVLRRFYGANPETSPDYGRIVSAGHLDRLAGYLTDGEIIGGVLNRETRYLQPTLVIAPPLDSPVMQEEIFGPILPLIPYDRLEDVIQPLRSRPTPLALYVFSSHRRDHDLLARCLPAGGVTWNDTFGHAVNPYLPFGGLGASGFGVYHGRAGFDALSHPQAVMRRSWFPRGRMKHPPYRMGFGLLKRIADRLFS